MHACLDEGFKAKSFAPILDGVREVLADNGVRVDRIQIPMTKFGGFRHPTYWGVLLTWSRERAFDDSALITHTERAASGLPQTQPPQSSPYAEVARRQGRCLRINLREDKLDFALLEELAEQGRVDYLAFAINLPANPTPQYVSIAANTPFPEGVEDTIQKLRSLLSISLYAAYRSSQAIEVVRAYIGERTGPLVLNGDIARGHSETIETGIMFCDIRGFTALSESLGEAEIVSVMNELFEVIGKRASDHGGEILKFIGDAMLMVFRLEACSPKEVTRAMINVTREATDDIAEVAERRGLDLQAGFGCHLGEVYYGNIGTPTRLDFTVMGSAVNLTSRLEGLTKALGTNALFSEALAVHSDALISAGTHALKGITTPVPVFRLAPRSTRPS